MLRFGPAGADEEYKGKSCDIPAYLAQRGLNAFEVQCGRGVQMGEAGASVLRANAVEYGISLSIHAPYFINLANPERLEQNIDYIRQSRALAGWLGAGRIVVHTGALMSLSRESALANAAQTLEAILRAEGGDGDVLFCLETMGKINQLGNLDEVIALCKLDERLLPCIDFGHLYARTHGEADGEAAFRSVLDSVELALGLERARECHIHFSKIMFNKGGESKHLTFENNEGYGPSWEPLARLLKERAYRSTVISESRGTQTRDAAYMKEVYEAI